MATDVTNFGSLDVVDHDGATYGLKLAGTLVTATAAELNIMDTVTVTAAELNYLDIATLGTGAASKAVVLDASGDYTYPATATIVYPASSSLTLAASSTFSLFGTSVTATGAELNYLDITTLGTGAASKAVVLDANGDYLWPSTGELDFGTASNALIHGSGASGSNRALLQRAEQEQAGAMPVQQFAEMVGGAGANAAIAPVNGAGSA